MSGTVLGLMAVAMAATLAQFLLPEEGREGTRPLLHFLTALVVLALLLRPFLSFLGNADGFLQGEWQGTWEEMEETDFERRFADAVAARSAEQLRTGLREWLKETHGLAPEDCEIAVVLTEEGDLDQIRIFLLGGGLLKDPAEIRGDLAALFDCQVEVR